MGQYQQLFSFRHLLCVCTMQTAQNSPSVCPDLTLVLPLSSDTPPKDWIDSWEMRVFDATRLILLRSVMTQLSAGPQWLSNLQSDIPAVSQKLLVDKLFRWGEP